MFHSALCRVTPHIPFKMIIYGLVALLHASGCIIIYALIMIMYATA
jgi:hypothetical protein